MACGLDALPFLTKESAQIASNLDSNSFGVCQLTNDTRYWYYVSFVDGIYKINFKDTSFSVPISNNQIFETLKARLNNLEYTNNSEDYIANNSLINNYAPAEKVAPQSLTRVII